MEKPLEQIHIPVLRKEIVRIIDPKKGGRYLDGTLGLGGHAEALLEACEEIEICGLDRDNEALELAERRLARFGERVHYFNLPFSSFEKALGELGWQNVNGAMLDLGVSSLQLDQPERGFSFLGAGPLDMRMGRDSSSKTASELVNKGSFEELREIFTIYGEEPQAARIARKIIESRQKGRIETTLDLAAIVASAYPAAWRKKARNHPATRAFQALRIAVNGEMVELKSFMEHILPYLARQARLAIISFHSLEDRCVKRCMRSWTEPPPGLDEKTRLKETPVKLLFRKPLVPSEAEEAANPRARSAKLRAIEKT